MNNNNHSAPASLNGQSHGIADSQGRLWFNNFRLFSRKPRKTALVSEPASDWRNTPNTGYRPDGTYNHDKPTEGESQMGLAGKIPNVAFGMPDAEYAALQRAARVSALCGLTLTSVAEDARRRFEARWAQCRAQFAARIANGRRVTDRLNARAAALQCQIDGLPLLVPDSTRALVFPRDVRAIYLLFLVLLWIGIVVADWWLLASKQFDAFGEVRTPLICTASWLVAPLLLKWALLSRAGRVTEWLLAAFKSFAVTMMLVFVVLYAKFGLGSGSAVTERIAAALAPAVTGAPVPAAPLDIGWAVFALQIILCLCASTALTVQIRELLVGRTTSVLNPDRQALETDLSGLRESISHEEACIAPHTGLLEEYASSLARFVGHGERAWHAPQAERAWLEQQQALLNHQRALIEETRRLLDL